MDVQSVKFHPFTIHHAISRLTIVNHKAKKKQAVRDKRVSYLHIASTTVKLANTLNKLL